MYRVTLIFFAIIIGMTVVEEIVFATWPVSESAATVYDRVSGLAISIGCGIFGNGWYRAHTRREIAQIRSLRLKDEDCYQALARRGGTNFLAGVGFVLLFAVLVVGSYFVTAYVFDLGDVDS